VTTVKISTGTPTDPEYGNGEMYIDSSTGEIWIYS
jgi:hypothetical protein